MVSKWAGAKSKTTIRQTAEKPQVHLPQWLTSKFTQLWKPHPAKGREEWAQLCAACTVGAACKLQAGLVCRGTDTRGITSSALICCALHLLLETQPAYSTALFLVLPPSSLRSKQHLTSISCKTLSSHDAFSICRLITLKNKWLGFFWAICGEPCRDETLAYEAHYDHTAAVTFSMQQRKAGFSVHVNSIMKQLRGRPDSATTFILLKNSQSRGGVQAKIRGSFQPFYPRLPHYGKSHK